MMSRLFLIALAGTALVSVVRAEAQEAQAEAGCRPCGIPRPGRRPCCPSSSDMPQPPPPEPCPCCPAPPSDYWCPCECPSSSSTICPPPPIPIPPCPVYCCESSSSYCSSSSEESCHFRRVPVPMPFLKPRCKPKPSSSSSCCCCPCPAPCQQQHKPTMKPRRRQHKPRGCGCAAKADIELELALANPEVAAIFEDVIAVQNEVDEEVLVLTHRDVELLNEVVEAVEGVVVDEKKGPCHPSCDKKKALQIVFQQDRKFVDLVNAQDLAGLYKLVTDNSRYAMISPNADAPGCSRVVGPLSQFLPNYIGYQMSSVFQDIVYNRDGSVTIHTLDVLTQGANIMAQDVWRTYKASTGCNYKIDYLNGTNWLCKCPSA